MGFFLVMHENFIFDIYYTLDMRPPKEKLEPFVNDRQMAAEKYKVSERTVSRWMQYYGILERKNNMGCNKLDANKAHEIRQKRSEGATLKELAEEFGVTFSTISRIIHNINYKELSKDTAQVRVVYNP